MKGDRETVNFVPVARLREWLEGESLNQSGHRFYAMCGIELCGLCGFAQEETVRLQRRDRSTGGLRGIRRIQVPRRGGPE